MTFFFCPRKSFQKATQIWNKCNRPKQVEIIKEVTGGKNLITPVVVRYYEMLSQINQNNLIILRVFQSSNIPLQVELTFSCPERPSELRLRHPGWAHWQAGHRHSFRPKHCLSQGVLPCLRATRHSIGCSAGRTTHVLRFPSPVYPRGGETGSEDPGYTRTEILWPTS